MKTIIKSVDISATPHCTFRTTKAGKKILIGEPKINLRVYLGVDALQEVQNMEIVFISDISYIYLLHPDNKSALLTNVVETTTHPIFFKFRIGEEIEATIVKQHDEGCTQNSK